MKEIKLSKTGKNKNLNLVALVDDEDYERVNSKNWFIVKTKRGVSYACGRTKVNGKSTTLPLHRFILNLTDKTKVIDHKDHDGLNNTKNNLRVCSQRENVRYSRPRKNKSSKFKGVSLFTQRIKGRIYLSWTANIRVDNTRTRIGSFKTEHEAAIAYNKKAVELFGDFAYLNKVN